jgi:cytochrome c oxidase subunit IV
MTDGTDLVTIEPDETPAATGAELEPVGARSVVPADEHTHPGPRQYVLIAIVLVILTAVEVATSYLEGHVNSNILIIALATMAAIKFYLVAAWYMHMKQDNHFFRRAFTGGIILACFVYGIVMFMFASTVLQS